MKKEKISPLLLKKKTNKLTSAIIASMNARDTNRADAKLRKF